MATTATTDTTGGVGVLTIVGTTSGTPISTTSAGITLVGIAASSVSLDVTAFSAATLTTISFNATSSLTTIFTTSAFCNTGPWTSIGSTQGVLTCNRTLTSTAACYPPDFVELQETGGIYSPGVCPSGYVATRTWTVDGNDATTSICCPAGMSYLQPFSSCATSFSSGVATSINISGSVQTFTDGFTAFAPTLAVAWASSDLADFYPASAPLTQGHAVTTTSIISSSITSAIVITTTPEPTSTGLSTGAQAGIGVGVAVAALALIGLGIWLFWRRRKRNAQKGATEPPAESKAELPADEEAEKKVPELGADGQVVEMSGYQKPTEVAVNDQPAELDTGWRGHEAATTLKSPT